MSGLSGQKMAPRVFLRNVGKTKITSCDLSLTYNGNTNSQSLSGMNLSSLDTFSVALNTEIQLANFSSDAILKVSNINNTGNDNDTSDDSKTITINPLIPATGKLVIGEEFTGTWCGYCPRGTVFLNYMEKKYGQYFQGIAIHNGDPMVIPSYDGVTKYFITSYPTLMTDRIDSTDPSLAEALFLSKITTAPKGIIVNGAEYIKDSSLLKVSLTVTFNNNESGDYRMACVLTEDSVTGTTTDWDQHNYYAGGSKGPMGGFENLANPVPAATIHYDHVARVISPSFYGLQNSFPSSISAGTKYNLTFKFDVSSYNMNHLHIIGMLINPKGFIDNGSTSTLSEAEANGYQSTGTSSGINEMLSPQKIVVYPNPASDHINISGIRGNAKVYITEISGREILSFNTNSSFSSLPVGNLNNGIYIVRIVSENEVSSMRVVIQK